MCNIQSPHGTMLESEKYGDKIKKPAEIYLFPLPACYF